VQLTGREGKIFDPWGRHHVTIADHQTASGKAEFICPEAT
jgi:hypothetical protein